jgi:hypothetical protein
MRANLGVIGTKIIVFDGKRGQIIYTTEELGEQVYMYYLMYNDVWYQSILLIYECMNAGGNGGSGADWTLQRHLGVRVLCH